jgi:hypothetical protein
VIDHLGEDGFHQRDPYKNKETCHMSQSSNHRLLTLSLRNSYLIERSFGRNERKWVEVQTNDFTSTKEYHRSRSNFQGISK